MDRTRLILASRSPRRKTLLGGTGVPFDVIESGIDEMRGANEPGSAYALRMAREKALAVSARCPEALVLGADTIVICGEEILVKPDNPAEARRMLATLSGKTHLVITAYALASAGVVLTAEPVTSKVTFNPLSDDQINEYVATGEPLDKAGAYGIQGSGGDFIMKVEGSRENVMGLPVREVLSALARFGVTPEPDR